MFPGNKTVFKIGEDIKVFLTLHNCYNAVRKRGGDQLRVRIFNTTLSAFAPGDVIDHYNGSFTVVVRATWPGWQTISITLAYRRETIRAIYSLRKKVRSSSLGLLSQITRQSECTSCTTVFLHINSYTVSFKTEEETSDILSRSGKKKYVNQNTLKLHQLLNAENAQ